MGKIIAGILTSVALVTGFASLGNYLVTHPYLSATVTSVQAKHDLDLAQVANTLERLQQNAAIKSAQDELFYWQRTENELKSVKFRLGKSPSREFEEKLNEAVQNTKEAQQRLRKLQEVK